MSEKRKAEETNDESREFKSQFGKYHTLDSDEEEISDTEHLNEDEIEGEEDGIARVEVDEDVKITPFNMKEELEEGHFDADGHYQFHKDADIKDNWLDNIDWVKVKKDANYKEKYNTADTILSSSSEDEDDSEKPEKFDLIKSYREILTFMEPKESIKKSLQRLGKNKPKLTTAQRWKLKKQGITEDSSDNITKLTELANSILTETGNMDIYEETFEKIQSKVREFDDKQAASSSKMETDALDLFADDFDEKEKVKVVTFKTPAKPEESTEDNESTEVMWEYKIKQEDSEILGPFSSQQMQNKVDSGEFKDHVFVRKVVKNRSGDDDEKFYTSSRIDFDLYI